jgi:hypothetical protein
VHCSLFTVTAACCNPRQPQHSVLLRKPAGAPVGATDASWSTHPLASPYLVQPSVIRPFPGKKLLRAFFRDRNATWIYTATSPDDGVTYVEISARGF